MSTCFTQEICTIAKEGARVVCPLVCRWYRSASSIETFLVSVGSTVIYTYFWYFWRALFKRLSTLIMKWVNTVYQTTCYIFYCWQVTKSYKNFTQTELFAWYLRIYASNFNFLNCFIALAILKYRYVLFTYLLHNVFICTWINKLH